MVSPEQGQKIPETATEAEAASGEPTETSSDIPNSDNCNSVNNDGNVIKEVSSNENKPEILPEKRDSDAAHHPGIVHTV